MLYALAQANRWPCICTPICPPDRFYDLMNMNAAHVMTTPRDRRWKWESKDKVAGPPRCNLLRIIFFPSSSALPILYVHPTLLWAPPPLHMGWEKNSFSARHFFLSPVLSLLHPRPPLYEWPENISRRTAGVLTQMGYSKSFSRPTAKYFIWESY